MILYDKVPFICNFNTEYNIRYIMHHLMSTKCLEQLWSPENDMKVNEIGNALHAFVKSILHILVKIHTKNYHPASLRRRVGG